MKVNEEAARLHEAGFNCAQSVLAACRDYTGLDEKTSLAISGGFGGGVRCGEICGAVSGAVMALGLTAPYSDPDDAEARTKIAKQTKELTKAFQEEFGCIRCLDLKRSGKSCASLIDFASRKVETMLEQK